MSAIQRSVRFLGWSAFARIGARVHASAPSWHAVAWSSSAIVLLSVTSHAGGTQPTTAPTVAKREIQAKLVRTLRGPVVRRVTSMAIVDDGLAIADGLVDPHVSWIDVRNGSTLSKIAAEGTQGFNLRDVGCLQPLRARNQVSFVDPQTRSLLAVELRSRGSRVLSVRQWSNVIPHCAFQFGDLVLIDAAYPDRVFYHASARTGELMNEVGATPPLLGEIPYNSKISRARRSGGAIAVTYRYVNRVETFDTLGRRTHGWEGPSRTEPRLQMAYVGLAVTEDGIYAGYCGCFPERERREPSVREIHVFDWSGKLRSRITLDREVWEFAVVEGGRKMFAAYGPADRMDIGEFQLEDGGIRVPRGY